MRKIINISILLLILANVSAQHFVGGTLSGSAGYMTDNIDITHSRFGGGADLGFVYEYQRGAFILDIGLQASWSVVGQDIDSMDIDYNMVDTRGIPFSYLGRITERTDKMLRTEASVPILIGAEVNNVYVLGGAKVNMTLLGLTRQNARLYTAGDYLGRYYDLFENMPNHGFYDYTPIKSEGRITFLPDVRLYGEIGGNVNTRLQAKLRIGLFAEYSLLNVNKGGYEADMVIPDLSRYMYIDMTNVYASKTVGSSPLHNLSFGVRLTMLFNVGGQSYDKNSNCHCMP